MGGVAVLDVPLCTKGTVYVMGACPQGNRKARLIASGDIWDWLSEEYDPMHRTRKRTDRYKSRYRARRRFKRQTFEEIREYERKMNCFEDLFGREE